MQSIARIVLAFLMLAPHLARAGHPGPESAVRAFYQWDIAHAHASSDRSAFKRFVSAELVCLVKAHARYLRAHGQTYPDLKPALAEFDYFSGFPGTPTRFTLKKSKVAGESAWVEVQLFRDEPGYRDPEGLNATVQLSKAGRDWIITDVSFSHRIPLDRLTAALYADMAPDRDMRWDERETAVCRTKP